MKTTTVYPSNACKSFNEWSAYVRRSVVNAQLSEEAQIDLEAEEFVKKLKFQITNKS